MVILSDDFDIKNGDTFGAIRKAITLKFKYANQCSNEKESGESIWDFILRKGTETDKKAVQEIIAILGNYSDEFAPDPDNTCENGYYGNVSSIDCSGKSLAKLKKGWEQLSSVSYGFDLRNNNIRRLDHLTGLTRVGEDFLFDSDKISDFSGLVNLQSVGRISFNDNQYITDLSFLSSLTYAYKLYAQNTSLRSLNGLHGSFYYLYVDNNPNLTDISALGNVSIRAQLTMDDKNYDVKIPTNAWLCNDGYSRIIIGGHQATEEDKNKICDIY